MGSASSLTLKAHNSKAEGIAQAWGPEVVFPFSTALRVAAPIPGLDTCSTGMSAHRVTLAWTYLQIEIGSYVAQVGLKL